MAEATTDKNGQFRIPAWFGVAPLLFSHLSNIDVFIGHRDYLPLESSVSFITEWRFVDATPPQRGSFTLIPLSAATPERIARQRSDLSSKICIQMVRHRSEAQVARNFLTQIGAMEEAPSSDVRMRACGFGPEGQP
jgi:hypothetical protein